MSDKNKINTKIFGNDYTLVGSESKEHLLRVCNEVDDTMRKIAQDPSLKPLKISVLTAINMCNELCKTRDRLDDVMSELDACKDEVMALRSEIQALEEEKRFLKNEIQIRKNGLR
ncbi:MAG: cell division protein ZapA [Clostridia bacterium]|nr:cell division protein ZapA [Clostridia bacterium]